MIAGTVGVPFGSYLSQTLRPRFPNCDPLICACGLLLSSPMVYFAIIVANVSFGWNMFFVFLAQVTLNITWPLVTDIVLVSGAIFN